MKKTIFFVVVLVGVFAGAFALYKSPSEPPETVASVPYVTVDGTTYYSSTLYADSILPNGSVLIETVKDAEGHTNKESVSTHGVEIGSEIYQNEYYPGWVFTLFKGALRRFTVWELACPMLRYNDTIYISVDYFTDSGCAKEYGSLNPTELTDEYEPMGNLVFGEDDTVPLQNLEVSVEFYHNSQLYCNKNDDSTVYIELSDHRGVTWYEAFYNAVKIPIDYSVYIRSMDESFESSQAAHGVLNDYR